MVRTFGQCVTVSLKFSALCPFSPLAPPSSVKVASDILCPLNICFHCCFIAYWNMYRGWVIFMANIWSTSSPKIYAFQDIGEKHSIMRLVGSTLHYAARAMGAMTLRISKLCLSFSPHPNIPDGNFNLVHHFICVQIFQINKKGTT